MALTLLTEKVSRGIRVMRLVGMHVLLIEDVADIREVFAILLRAEGADVVATGSGREGAELARNGRYDVVLSDLGLPDIAGDSLIKQIRTTSPAATRVVVITGYGEPYLTRARQAGADAVFTKPVEWTQILDYIRWPDLAASA
jgi:two-component system, chemotaxis family, CheB/CheR fusion protein